MIALLRAGLALMLALGLGGQALAGVWTRVETERFVVYGESHERVIRDYALKLTTYDAVLRMMNPGVKERVASQKLNIYLLRSRAELKVVAPGLREEIVGFYHTGPGEVFAVGVAASGIDPDVVLFHEYAHHFMLANFPSAYPAWLTEGWAEYFAPTQIKGARVKVGGYVRGRAAYLFTGQPWLPMEDLLSKRPSDLSRSQNLMFYSQAWLLTHYMRADLARATQMDAAIVRIGKGEPPVQAFEAATGLTMKQLTAALRKYTSITEHIFANPLTSPPPMVVSKLPDSADQFLLDRLRLAMSVPSENNEAFLLALRAKAARQPNDRFAQLTLATAELRLGEVAAGETIVKRWIDADPMDMDALRAAAIGYVQAADRTPQARAAYFKLARTYAGKAYALDQEDARILYVFAYARTMEANYPTQNDLNALLAANDLAPSVREISVMLGDALIKRGRREDGLSVLERVANDPHESSLADVARAIIAGKPTGVIEAVAQQATTPQAPSAGGPGSPDGAP